MGGARILVADDEETFLLSTGELLRREGYDCVCVQDAQEAGALLHGDRFELLVADVNMPGNANLELVRDLQRAIPGLPVILVTGRPTLASAIDAVGLPVTAYLLKPLDIGELLAAVRAALAQCRDGAESFSLERRAAVSEARYHGLVEAAPDGIVTVDKRGRIVLVNARTLEMFGYAREELLGRPVEMLLPTAQRGRHVGMRDGFLAKPGRRAMGSGLVVRGQTKDGRDFPVDIALSQFTGDLGLLGTAIIRDVSDVHELVQRMSHQAAHDALTDLVNRTELERRLSRLIEEAHRDGTVHALCYLDLDQFKVINDSCGHLAGDELLQRVAALLREHTRCADTVARVGGDEFCVVLENCMLDKAVAIAESLCRAVNGLSFVWEGKHFAVGASIGVAPVTSTCADVAAVLSAADTACYVAKDEGRNRVYAARADDAGLARRQADMQWFTRITRALGEDLFGLHWQPIAPTVGGGTEGMHYELLLRLCDQPGKVLAPGNLLAAAERYNLATRIDRWVVTHALGWLHDNPRELDDIALFCINLSGQSLSEQSFLDFVVDALRQAAVPPQKVCFEITETAAIANLTRAIEFMQELHAFGCRFALDDFGSGLSSFAYLKNLPVDYLKIDGAFVRGMMNDTTDLALVRSINEIGHLMGKRTIAECVEDEAAVRALAELGVDYVQGYAVGRPVALGTASLPSSAG